MSRTKRWWNKKKNKHRLKILRNPHNANSSRIFNKYKEINLRKYERHSIRCQNRTRFSHAIYEPLIEKSLQRNIVYKID